MIAANVNTPLRYEHSAALDVALDAVAVMGNARIIPFPFPAAQNATPALQPSDEITVQ